MDRGENPGESQQEDATVTYSENENGNVTERPPKPNKREKC